MSGETPPPASLEIRAESDGPSHVLWLTGELDLVSAGVLETRIAELCADGAGRIVLELGTLEFMDSTGLRALLTSQELCGVNSCQLLIGGMSAQVSRLLELSGLEGRLERA